MTALRDEWKELRDEVLHGETMSVEHLIEQVVKMKKEMDELVMIYDHIIFLHFLIDKEDKSLE